MTVRIEVLEHNHEVAGDEPFTMLVVNISGVRARYVAFAEPYGLTTVIDGLKLLAEALNVDNRVTLDKTPEEAFNAGDTVIPGEDNDTGT